MGQSLKLRPSLTGNGTVHPAEGFSHVPTVSQSHHEQQGVCVRPYEQLLNDDGTGNDLVAGLESIDPGIHQLISDGRSE
jgi:hypothetical protein